MSGLFLWSLRQTVFLQGHSNMPYQKEINQYVKLPSYLLDFIQENDRQMR